MTRAFTRRDCPGDGEMQYDATTINILSQENGALKQQTERQQQRILDLENLISAMRTAAVIGSDIFKTDKNTMPPDVVVAATIRVQKLWRSSSTYRRKNLVPPAAAEAALPKSSVSFAPAPSTNLDEEVDSMLNCIALQEPSRPHAPDNRQGPAAAAAAVAADGGGGGDIKLQQFQRQRMRSFNESTRLSSQQSSYLLRHRRWVARVLNSTSFDFTVATYSLLYLMVILTELVFADLAAGDGSACKAIDAQR